MQYRPAGRRPTLMGLLIFALLGLAPAWAGTLNKGDIQRRFGVPFEVQDKLIDIPAWPVTSSLEKEIGQIKAYIELFQLKSEQPLPIRFDIEGAPDGRQLEPLLLLPMVENALKHGDLENNPEGIVRIALHNEPDRLVFEVENSFNPDDLQKDEVGGVGLENIRRRLEIDYRGRYVFETSQPKQQTFKTRLELKFINA